MALSTTDFSGLTAYLDEVFLDASSQSVEQMGSKELFDIQDTDREDYIYRVLHGVAGIRKVAEGADFPIVSGLQGDSATWTQVEYGAAIQVTDRIRRFWLENQPSLEEQVRTITDESFHKIDQSLADVLIHGFSAANYVDVYNETVGATCPDAVAVFSASHTNGATSATFSNLIQYPVGTVNPPLSREAIVQARVDALNYKDPNGLNRPIVLDLLIVPPSKYDEGLRHTGSDKISGSFENDINPLKGNVRVMQWSKLTTAADTTNGSAFWYMADSRNVKKSLKAFFGKRPSLEAPTDVQENADWNYRLFFYYSIGRAWPCFIWGSNGTSA